MCNVIAIANQKGGVGKTTATIELATNLKLLKKKVLVIDLDQQGDTTRTVDGDATFHNIYEVLTVEVPITEAIQETPYFDLICSSKKLNMADKVFTDREDILLLQEVVNMIRDKYDYILIDNNPDVGMLFNMSMVASDYVIIPTFADNNAMEGIIETQNVLEKLTKGKLAVSNAKVLAYILSMREQGTNMHTIAIERLKELAEENPDNPIVAWISKGVKIQETSLYQIPVSYREKASTQAREYYSLAELIDSRLKMN